MSRTVSFRNNFPAYSAVVGGGVWLFFEALAEFQILDIMQIEVALLLAPLVVFPLGLRAVLLDSSSHIPRNLLAAAVYSQPVCALAVCISYLYPTGVTAGALALAWFFYTALLAALGLVRVAVERKFASDQLALNAGLLYSIIGGGWLVLSRLGATPMDFGHLITLLTSVHFHYAGFAALVFVGLTGRRLTRAVPSLRPIYDLLVYGTILSISLLAVGITLSPLIEVISAFILAACLTVLALMTFIIVVRRVRKKSARTLLAIASVSLVVGMVFALLYAVSQYSESYVISILRMAHYHGWANSLLFSVCGLWAWNLAESVE